MKFWFNQCLIVIVIVALMLTGVRVSDGWTVRSIAEKEGHKEIVELFRDASTKLVVKQDSYSENKIYKFLARPFLITEVENQECSFEPPFKYGGPIFRNSFSKSVAQITALPLRSFRIGLVPCLKSLLHC